MIEEFGALPDGQIVHRLHLQGGGLDAYILTLGAIVQDLRIKGVAHPLVLGAPMLAPYLGPMQYFGAMVGRFANRIAQGQFELGGQVYQVSQNNNGHCLHGGVHGSAQRVWQVLAQRPDTATLALHMPDGEMGFPGALDVTLTIALEDGALCFDIRALTDRDTICTFAHHGYFALDDSGSLAQHQLQVAADHYLPVDATLIPLGEISPVTADFDYRAPRPLRDVTLDHNFCLLPQRTSLRPVAWLRSDASDLEMRLETTEPGLQVYTAAHLPHEGVIGHHGRPLGRHAGLALEPQIWPDAPNNPNFPNAILRLGALRHQRTRYVFSLPS